MAVLEYKFYLDGRVFLTIAISDAQCLLEYKMFFAMCLCY